MFQSIVDASRFDLSNPITVNSASIKGLMNQTPTLIMDLNRVGSRLFCILGQAPRTRTVAVDFDSFF